MPKQVRWKGDDLWYLLNVPTKELRKMYPQYTEGGLKGMRGYWKRKIKLGEAEMPPKPEQEPASNFGEILKLHHLPADLANELTEQGFHIGYIKNSDGEIEYTVPLPHAKGRRSNTEDFQPATPANIRPSTTKPVKRPYGLILAFSDAQIDYRRLPDNTLSPLHDERALKVMTQIAKDLKPNEIVNLGDTVDLSSLSHFDADSDHFYRTLGPSFQRAHDLYAQLRADNPDAKIVEVDSNHNTRLRKFVGKYAMTMMGLTRPGDESKYPVLSYPFLTNLEHLDVEWISGYGAAQYEYRSNDNMPPIIFKHGETVVSQGSTAARESKNYPDAHVVRGHGHRMETQYRTTRHGEYLASVMVGALCKITGEVPSYHSAVSDLGYPVHNTENWQQGIMLIIDHEGDYTFNHVPIIEGRAYYNGKEYTA